MKIIITIGIVFLKLIYALIKLLPTRNKMTFISRQSNFEPVNFLLLQKKLTNIETIILAKKLEKGFLNKIKYLFHMLRQMYHIATSKIVILDSYCICISILNHKKNLKTIQMWHAMGAIKKFGYSTIGKNEGSKKDLTVIMKMHNNYDYIFASSSFAKIKFEEAFNSKNIVKFALPITDLLLSKTYNDHCKKKIYSKYKNLGKKENILYVPTFRLKNNKNAITKLVNSIDFNKYNVIIKNHHLSKLNIRQENIMSDNEFTTQELLCIADIVITDYSAVLVEAAIMKKKIYLYNFDFEDYNKNRGFYFDYLESFKGIYYDSPEKLIKSIENEKYDYKIINKFLNKMVDVSTKNVTNQIVKFINKIK